MKRVLHVIFGIIGAVLGVTLIKLLLDSHLIAFSGRWGAIGAYIGGGLAGCLLLFFLSEPITRGMRSIVDGVTVPLRRIPLSQVVLRTIGLIIGLLIASIISSPVLRLSVNWLGNVLGVIISVLLYILLGLLGVRMAALYHDEILQAVVQLRDSLVRTDEEKVRKALEKEQKKMEKSEKGEKGEKKGHSVHGAQPKILDTSVVIDGRIFAVRRAGFLEGPIVISHYVLEELQHISDSSDAQRRERGRLGLDHIHELQKAAGDQVIVDNDVINNVREVDSKLMVLTQRYHGVLVTNDFNLNKVARVQNIPVLNVNDLSNAIKPVVIPGEHLSLDILRAGKEPGQGLSYLEDGTMVVVENGGDCIGQHADTVVTSVLQTSAGKMIFTRIPE